MRLGTSSVGALFGVVALAVTACAGPAGPATGSDPNPATGVESARPDPRPDVGDTDETPSVSDTAGSRPRTTQETLAAIRSLDPARLSSLHDHAGSDHGETGHPDNPPDSSPDSSPGGHAGAEPPRHPQGVDPERLVVPAIDVDAEVIDLGLQEDGSMEVPSDFSQTGWFAPGPRPGRVGPAVIAGHVDSRDGPAVFHRLTDLQVGDEIQVHGEHGEVVRFGVTGIETHPKAAFPTQRVYAGTPNAALRLITCGGEFDRTRGSYRDNVIVYAERTHP